MNNIQRPVFISPRSLVRFRRLIKCRGQTLVEYALILAIISIVIVGVIVNVGKQVTAVYSMVDSQVASAPGAASTSSSH